MLYEFRDYQYGADMDEDQRTACVRVVLIGENGENIEPHAPSESPDIGVKLRETGHWLSEHRDVRARSGPRMGPSPESPRCRGTVEEVVSPVAVAPDQAIEIASDGAVLTGPLGAMSVDGASCTAVRAPSGVGRLAWKATIRTGRFTRRSASLRLRPSPSNNLTIIELTPDRAPWFRTGAFVNAGVPAVDELCRRLRAAAASVA